MNIDIIQRFLDYLHHEKKHAQRTYTAYQSDLNEFSSFCQKQFDLKDLTKVNYKIIREWLAKLADNGMALNSLNRKASSLKGFYKFLVQIQELKSSPMDQHKHLKPPKRLVEAFTEEELNQVFEEGFVEGYEGDLDRMIVEMLYATGFRRSELIGFKLEDYDDYKRLMRVRGKGDKDRMVPVTPHLKKMLDTYLIHRKTVETPDSPKNMLLNPKGKKLSESYVYRRIKGYFSKVSSKKKVSPHILRHTFATHLINNGVSINAVKELLGHSSLATTQLYANVRMGKVIQDYRKSHPRANGNQAQIQDEKVPSPKPKMNYY